MANDERKPLLIRVNPSWKRKIKLTPTAIPSIDVGSTSSNVHGNSSDAISRISNAVNKDAADNRKVKVALASILASVVLERMVFYGLIGNLVMFLNLDPFNWKIYSAVSAIFLFFGISYIMSLIGGWIADSFLGRFKTMVLSYVIYICSYVILPFISIDTESGKTNGSLPDICLGAEASTTNGVLFDESCSWLIMITLISIAVSAGILKANICPFGSDQLVGADQQTQLSFFNWFYWCVNIGSFLALGVITYIEQQEKFLYGFIACSVALVCSAVIFITGYPFYISRPPDGSVLSNIFRIIQEAWRNKRKRQNMQQNLNEDVVSRSSADTEVSLQAEKNIPFLDNAKSCYGGAFQNSLVDDVKKLGMILAVFAVLIPYWLVYFQMQSTFLLQGLNMKLSFTGNDLVINATNTDAPKIAAAWFSLCDALVVIILLPLFDRIIYPRMAKADYHFTFAKRIILGMLFAIAAVVAAGVVEHFRWKALNPDPSKACFNNYTIQRFGRTTYYASEMSVLWQIPQYTLIGISEVFASVASLQFTVMIAPNSMKSAITGLFYFFSGFGSFLGIALLSILIKLNSWFPNRHNINCWYPCALHRAGTRYSCHFDYYFYFLAGCEGLGLIMFIIIARMYKINIDELTFHAKQRSVAVRR